MAERMSQCNPSNAGTSKPKNPNSFFTTNLIKEQVTIKKVRRQSKV